MTRRRTRTRRSPSTATRSRTSLPPAPPSARPSCTSPPITSSTAPRPRLIRKTRFPIHGPPMAGPSWPASERRSRSCRTPPTCCAPPGSTARTAPTSSAPCSGWPTRASVRRWSTTSAGSPPGASTSPGRSTPSSRSERLRASTTPPVPARRPGTAWPTRSSSSSPLPRSHLTQASIRHRYRPQAPPASAPPRALPTASSATPRGQRPASLRSLTGASPCTAPSPLSSRAAAPPFYPGRTWGRPSRRRPECQWRQSGRLQGRDRAERCTRAAATMRSAVPGRPFQCVCR
jgi:hypothetical protein